MEPTDRLITAGSVIELTALPQATLYRLMGEGRFPRPVKVGRRSVRWIEREVVEWMDERIRERDRQEAASVG